MTKYVHIRPALVDLRMECLELAIKAREPGEQDDYTITRANYYYEDTKKLWDDLEAAEKASMPKTDLAHHKMIAELNGPVPWKTDDHT